MVFPSYFISLLMLVRQININKAIAGSQNLCLMISKGEISNIYLVQEPYRLKNGLIPGLPRDFKIYGTRSSRAIIIAHSKVPLFYSSELSSKDFTVCLYESEGIKKFFVSCYLDITMPVISDELTKIVDSITDSNIPGLIGMDSNSHSTMWNCRDTNSRGRALENLIFQYNLEILNKGSLVAMYSLSLGIIVWKTVFAHISKLSSTYCFQ